MLKRRNTVSSPNPATATIRCNGRIHRSKTVSHTATALTKSEMMAPEERNQQAVAAAKRAYGDDLQRRRSQIVRFETPVSSSENLEDTKYPQATTSSNSKRKTIRLVNEGENGDASTDYDLPEPCDTGNTKGKGRSGLHENIEQRSTPRGRRSMNFTTSDTDDYPGSYQSSNPSSYKRLQKTRSMFSVGQMFSKDSSQDEYSSSVVYSSERSPDSMSSKNRRKSTSFLRGGTDFMPESVRRQLEEEKYTQKDRKSFYLSTSKRHSTFPETVRGKKKDPDESVSISVRKAVGEKARKISASFFGTMRRALGKKVKLEPAFPEQHVTSTRQHFRDYVSPSELHEDIIDIPEPNNLTIRPAVISRAPTFRHVPSCEMLRSVAGSLGEATPPMKIQPPHRISSTTTDGKSTWNATLGASLKKKRLSIIDENMPNKIKDNIYSPPSVGEQQVRKSYEAKRVYSALMRRLDRGSPSARREEAEYVHGPGYNGPGYYMAPGLALRPEEENMFERPYTAASTNTVVTAIRKDSGKWTRDLNSGGGVPPPVPARPLSYQQGESSKSNTKEWVVSNPVHEELRQMSVDSQLAGLAKQVSGLAIKSEKDSGPPVDIPITPQNTVRRRLRVTRSASTFFPYSSSVDELVRESTPSPYRKATGIMDTDSRSSAYTDITVTPKFSDENTSPPQMAALTQGQSEYTYRGVTIAPLAPKMKIRSGLKIKDYNPNWNHRSTLAGNGDYNTPRNTPRNTVSSISMNENYTSSKLNNENENRKRKSKALLRSGSQGHGIPPVVYRPRSVLSQMSTVDIENAVNTQFGPVVGGEGMGWKGKSKETIVEERVFMERRMESHSAFI
ncbi:hypothetical protein P167DRAFT_577148 [Morchella conica CCBAS932]|uniref:Uncharacterized protein n=1 Tax=Morchella conica CCBAS932 TaxID=1392247 RepID=A0A3N4KG72_9PEZI|nr:hypothetical protein P167DRAFT_577148 [Morchella conica CCBAS932]